MLSGLRKGSNLDVFGTTLLLMDLSTHDLNQPKLSFECASRLIMS